MKFKLDKTVFQELFPVGKCALDTLTGHIDDSVEKSVDKVVYQMKLWDQKLFNLRSEINIGQVYKRLGTLVTEKTLL